MVATGRKKGEEPSSVESGSASSGKGGFHVI